MASEHPGLRRFALRVGYEMTAAPFSEGTYQAGEVEPVAVSTVTSSYGRPRSAGSTAARGRWVARIAIATGTTSQYAATRCRGRDAGATQITNPAGPRESARAPWRRGRPARRRSATRTNPLQSSPRAPTARAYRDASARSLERERTEHDCERRVAAPRGDAIDGWSRLRGWRATPILEGGGRLPRPDSGAMKESMAACSARIAIRPENSTTSWRAGPRRRPISRPAVTPTASRARSPAGASSAARTSGSVAARATRCHVSTYGVSAAEPPVLSRRRSPARMRLRLARDRDPRRASAAG